MNVDDEVRGITRLLLSCFRQLFFQGTLWCYNDQ